MRSGKKNLKMVGIDEVGRGPLAGPVTVCAVFASKDVLRRIKRSCFFTDSKKMTRKSREKVFEMAQREKDAGRIDYAISSVSSGVIDRVGINKAITTAIGRSLEKLAVPEDTSILLDGGLKAPLRFTRQKSIKNGDLLEEMIALASVLAKVYRDRRMMRYERRFPEYRFASNKGYGTKDHIGAIGKKGLCGIHRRSFVKNIIDI